MNYYLLYEYGFIIIIIGLSAEFKAHIYIPFCAIHHFGVFCFYPHLIFNSRRLNTQI